MTTLAIYGLLMIFIYAVIDCISEGEKATAFISIILAGAAFLFQIEIYEIIPIKYNFHLVLVVLILIMLKKTGSLFDKV